jgi:CHASE3 domain sensor protein
MSKRRQILKKIMIGLLLVVFSFLIGGGYAIYSLKSES